MADCSCDYCKYDETCQYAYDETDCMINQIREAKKIVDDEFINMMNRIQTKQDLIDNEELGHILFYMQNLKDLSVKDDKCE